jgi:hypothetical protein
MRDRRGRKSPLEGAARAEIRCYGYWIWKTGCTGVDMLAGAKALATRLRRAALNKRKESIMNDETNPLAVRPPEARG